MNQTYIEWVKNPDGTQGFSWNPLTGCLNHDNGICRGGGFPCYAYKLANGRVKSRYLSNSDYIARGTNTFPEDYNLLKAINDPFYPRLWMNRLYDVPCNGQSNRSKGKGIFVCDMSDLFGIGIPVGWTEEIMHRIKCNPQHRFYLLTKQGHKLSNFSPFPDNCWVGITATTTKMFLNACVQLSNIKATVRFISFEPMVEWQTPNNDKLTESLNLYRTGKLDWIIIGAQTKPNKFPDIKQVEQLTHVCTKANIPVFFKSNIRELLPLRMPFHSPVNWEQISAGVPIKMSENRLRQEMPNEK